MRCRDDGDNDLKRNVLSKLVRARTSGIGVDSNVNSSLTGG